MKRFLLASTALRPLPGGGHRATDQQILHMVWHPHVPFERLQVLLARMQNGSATRAEREEAARAANAKVTRLGDTELAGALRLIAA